jgi:hypothetical protein
MVPHQTLQEQESIRLGFHPGGAYRIDCLHETCSHKGYLVAATGAGIWLTGACWWRTPAWQKHATDIFLPWGIIRVIAVLKPDEMADA